MTHPEPLASAMVGPEEPTSAAHARLGSEALARLRGRYADVLAGLGRHVADEQRREQLREQAERLNPDNWVTDDEVTAGLEEYEAVLASLREVIGRRRRGRRGPGPGGAPEPEQAEDVPAGSNRVDSAPAAPDIPPDE